MESTVRFRGPALKDSSSPALPSPCFYCSTSHTLNWTSTSHTLGSRSPSSYCRESSPLDERRVKGGHQNCEYQDASRRAARFIFSPTLVPRNKDEISAKPRWRTTVTLSSLPPELHLLIAQELQYPDALALKQTSRYFYGLIDASTTLKIEWLLQRRRLHLDCPNHTRCDLGADLRFCRGSVFLLMQRRREHLECDSRPGLGCLVYGTTVCEHRCSWGERWRRWMRRWLSIELELSWSLLIGLLAPIVLVAMLCVVLLLLSPPME